jgi:ribose transport system substrate-binding protein
MRRVRPGAILGVVLVFSACGGGGRPAAKYRFAVMPKSLDLPVFNYARVGAERMARRLGNVEVIWRGPENADQLRQKEILESFITQRVDGIAISCLNGDFLTQTIDRAIEAGIAVVTWDADAPKSRRVAFYGVDDLAAGRIMGEEAVRLLSGRGKVAIVTSVGAVNLQRRLEGARSVLDRHPGIQVVEVYDVKEDPVRCAEIIASGTNRYPDLGAWISVGGLAGLHAQRAPGRRSRAHEVHLVRHHLARSGPAQGRQGAGPDRAEVLRLGQRVGPSPGRHQGRKAATLPDRRLRG